MSDLTAMEREIQTRPLSVEQITLMTKLRGLGWSPIEFEHAWDNEVLLQREAGYVRFRIHLVPSQLASVFISQERGVTGMWDHKLEAIDATCREWVEAMPLIIRALNSVGDKSP